MEQKIDQKRVPTFQYRQLSLTSVQSMSYFYIGHHFSTVGELVCGFESNHHFESFDAAIQTLLRLEKTDAIPDVILFDGTLPQNEIIAFLSAVSHSGKFQHVPLVAEVSACDDLQKNFLRRSLLVDDLHLVQSRDESLKRKVDFLKRVKAAHSPVMLQDKLSSGIKKDKSLKYFSKRLFDLVFSSVLLLILSPIFLLIALVIRLESRGPIFYVSQRAGKGYRVFNFIKFRTMIPDADKKVAEMMHMNQYNTTTSAQPVFFKVSNDPRITRIGAFLRNTSLDELPQLLNVFKGDMSLVGNRPLPLYEASTLTTDDFAKRFMAPAGITGLWQIKKRGESNITVEERIGLDIDYADKYSFAYDLWIIANTPTALLQKTSV